jgi:hypothetical protein
MTNALTEQSEWTLTYDYGEDQLQWDTNHELWAAWAMLEGIFRGMNVAGTDIPIYTAAIMRIASACGAIAVG